MLLSDISIRRPVFAWMLMFALLIVGWIGLTQLGVSEQPDVDFPVLTVNVTWSGAAPEVMETEIVDPLEENLVTTQGVRNVTSQIQQGQASIVLEFEVNHNIDAALSEVQSKLSQTWLPYGADAPTIIKTNPEDQPIILLSVSSTKRDLHALTEFVELNIRDQLQILPGVGQVVFAGYQPRNLRVWVQNEKLKRLQLTLLDVKNALFNEQVEQAAGYIENSLNQFNVRTMGEATTPEEIARIQIKHRGGEPIYGSNIHIGDVARIEDGLNDIQRVALVNGHEGLGIGIKKQHGSNAVAVAHSVKERLQELKAILPDDIKIRVNYDSTKFIEDAIHETEITLLLSAVITGLVCFFFLGSFSSTINVFLSIPTSAMGTFFILYLFDFTLNFFTLLGLSLAIGIVVDDAIMVLENIVRHLHLGKSKVFASLDGAREITFPALASTLAVIAIFLPVAFMHGIIGKFFFQFGITISAAVFLSLIEALTITPMRCSQFISTSSSRYTKSTDKIFQGLSHCYRKVLARALNHRWLVVLTSFVIFVISLFITELIPQEFLPFQDQGVYLIRIQTPIDSSLNFTKTRLVQAETILRQHPEIDHFFSAVGGFTSYSGASDGAVTDSQVNSALIYVTMTPKERRLIRQNESMNQVRQELNAIPGIIAIPQELTNRDFLAGRGFPIELNLRGPEYDQLQIATAKVIAALKASGEVTDIDTDFRVGMPEVRIHPDRDKATASGVSIDAIANTVQSAIGGIVQSRFSNADRRYDVRLRLEGAERLTPEDILKLQVRNDYGELIPISQVVHLETVKTFQTIARRLRERSITIYANVMPGKSQAEALDQAEKITKSLLPPGIRVFLGGGAQTFRETFSDLFFALGLGLVISYMILASQFNSYIHPLVVLLALPFSLSGALVALYLTHQSINLYSLIGIILLMGIVKKNSILLVEFTNQKRFLEGLSVSEAILAASPIRLRPILMTSLATLAAAVPPALALGPGAESRIPMAITILGGVSASTLLTLIVVPCAYRLLTHFESVRLEASLYRKSESTKEVPL